MAALDVACWRVTGNGGAAQLLGIPPSTLTNRMRSLGISKRPGGAPTLPGRVPLPRGIDFDND